MRLLKCVCIGAEEKLNLEKMELFQLHIRENLLKFKPSSHGPGGLPSLPSWWISIPRGEHAEAGGLSVKDVLGDSCFGNLDSIISSCGPVTTSHALYVPVVLHHPWTVFSLTWRETDFLNSSSFALVSAGLWFLRKEWNSKKPGLSASFLTA